MLRKYMMFASMFGILINMLNYAFAMFFHRNHWIKAIAVYGSCSRDKTHPNDIDILVVVEKGWARAHNIRYNYILGNLDILFRVLSQDCYLLPAACTTVSRFFETTRMWMEQQEEESMAFHIFLLPEDFFYDSKVMEEISKEQYDPMFFSNVFDKTLLWDSETVSFQRVRGIAKYKEMFQPAHS